MDNIISYEKIFSKGDVKGLLLGADSVKLIHDIFNNNNKPETIKAIVTELSEINNKIINNIVFGVNTIINIY
jgi:hypothetical protein